MGMLFSWFLALLPGLVYPAICYAYRRILTYKLSEIHDILTRANAADLYEKGYGGQAIQKLFELNYHWRAYILPVLINVLITTAAMLVTVARAGIPMGLPDNLQAMLVKVPSAVIAGIGGAFAWGLYDVLRRYRVIDLTHTALHFIWLRLLTSAVLGSLVSYTVAQPLDLLAAFGLGAFPLKTLQDFVKEGARKRFGIAGESLPSAEPNLDKIQGLTAQTIDRLSEEGIDSTQHLAHADPMKLLLKTNFEWKVILDIIDQSILFNYLGEKMNALRPLGIRGAIELAEIGDGLSAVAKREVKEHSEKMLPLIAGKLNGKDTTGVRNLIGTLIEDPHVDFIWTLWGEA